MWVLVVTALFANSMSVTTISGLESSEECFRVGHSYRLGNAGRIVTQVGGKLILDCIQAR